LEVGRSLVSELELDVVLERVLEAGRELTGARSLRPRVVRRDPQPR
jgi:hypothetical protein